MRLYWSGSARVDILYFFILKTMKGYLKAPLQVDIELMPMERQRSFKSLKATGKVL